MAIDELDAFTLRLLFDTAAVVLIWLVQLVIYPAFLHFQLETFRVWHPIYTRRVTFVVMPIMLGQLAVYAYLFLNATGWDVGFNLALTLGAWMITFFQAIPLHSALDDTDDHLALSAKLVALNWWRTALWTTIWLVSLLVFFTSA